MIPYNFQFDTDCCRLLFHYSFEFRLIVGYGYGDIEGILPNQKISIALKQIIELKL